MISVLLGMAAIVIGTGLGAPTMTPIVVGLAMGFLLHANPARRAALAGVLAWATVLLGRAVRGDEIGALSKTLGGAMGVPSWAIVVLTLLYPAILASSAAWLAHLAVRRRVPSIGGSAAREITPT
jgi:hypothetical protein